MNRSSRRKRPPGQHSETGWAAVGRMPATTPMTRALMALVLVALLGAGIMCTSEPDKLVFMAGFRAQANLPFVAAYVAQEKGYFEDQGLDVEIRHASTGEHLKLLLSGDVDITTAAASSVLKRRSDPGLPIVAFALFGQQSQQAYVALGNSGINTPKDWEGKTFGYKISVPPDYLAILEANGVDRSTINEVKVGFDPRVLTEGKVDVLAVFNSNEPDTIRRLRLLREHLGAGGLWRPQPRPYVHHQHRNGRRQARGCQALPEGHHARYAGHKGRPGRRGGHSPEVRPRRVQGAPGVHA